MTERFISTKCLFHKNYRIFSNPIQNVQTIFENIRRYNTAFASASLSAKLVKPPGRGPPVFRLCGQLYHNYASLYPNANNTPSFNQLYIYQQSEAKDFRLLNLVGTTSLFRMRLQQSLPPLTEHLMFQETLSSIHMQISFEQFHINLNIETPCPIRSFFHPGSQVEHWVSHTLPIMLQNTAIPSLCCNIVLTDGLTGLPSILFIRVPDSAKTGRRFCTS